MPVKSGYQIWRQIGETERGEAIFKNLDTGEIAVEKDNTYLVEPTKEDMEGAEIWEE